MNEANACVAHGLGAVQDSKLWLVCHLDLAKDALHVHVGLLVLVIAALVLRRRIGSWGPWAAVLTVAVLGEVVDLADQWRVHDPVLRWGDSLHDIVNTLVWPTALTLLARGTGLFRSGDVGAPDNRSP